MRARTAAGRDGGRGDRRDRPRRASDRRVALRPAPVRRLLRAGCRGARPDLQGAAAVIGPILGTVALLGLAFYSWRAMRRRQADERLAEIVRAGMSRDRFPSVYSGPDTRYGLACGTPCRIRGH